MRRVFRIGFAFALSLALITGCSDENGEGGGGGTAGAGGSAGAGGQSTELTHLYFLNNIFTLGGVLSTTLDGKELREFGVEESVRADGVAVDVEAGHVYWTNMGDETSEGFTNDGFILRANLDGTDITEIVPPGGTHTPKQLRIDPIDRKLYWSDREGMRVMRANLDGSDVETLVTIAEGEAARSDLSNHAVGIALDFQTRKFYWSQKGPDNGGVGTIKRAGFDMPSGEDSTNRSDIEVLFEGLPEPIDLAIDRSQSMLYWTDRGDETVNRAPMDLPADATPATRSDREILVSDIGEAIGIALDVERGVMYYTALGSHGRVWSAGLDGSNPTEIISHESWWVTGITRGPAP
jgi:hypothetical protein